MTDRNTTCAQRIENELANTEQWLSESYKKIDEASENNDDNLAEQLQEEIEPCSVGLTYTLKLELSGGGPSSWLEVELEKTHWSFEPVQVVYHFADWFDHDEREVTQTQAPGMWRLAQHHAELAEYLIEQRN